jgi:internalin A
VTTQSADGSAAPPPDATNANGEPAPKASTLALTFNTLILAGDLIRQALHGATPHAFLRAANYQVGSLDSESEVVELYGDWTQVPKEITTLPKLRRLVIVNAILESVPDVPGLFLSWDSYETHRSRIAPEHVAGIAFDKDTPEALPPVLHQLTNLRWLQIGGIFPVRTDAAAWPTGLDGLGQLEELSFYASSVTTLPPSLLELRQLKRLSVQASIPTFPDELAQLSNLQELTLNNNPLGRVPEAIRALREIRVLNLSGTGQRQLPGWLSELSELRVLWLGANAVRLTDSIGDLRGLTALGLHGNQLKELPGGLSHLGALRALHLAGNQFQQIPEAIFSLHSLEGLDISGPPGQITTVPERILSLPRLRLLDIGSQPIETPPPEVVTNGLESIRAYYRQLRQGHDYVCEAKLLIVGEPGAGKTSLARKLTNPEYALRDDQASTEGIDVTAWGFPTRFRVERNGHSETLSRDFQVSVWDFGGQEIYHATHQFFLTKRSVYVLVTDNRREDTDFQYWLNIVEALSDNSPIVIVTNEKQQRRRDVNESRLRARFSNLRAVLATDLATNRGLADVVRVIRDELERLPHVGTALPQTWRRVREALDRDDRDYLGVGEYLTICREHGFTREDDMLQLSSFLHDLGVCLHFQDDPLLRKTVLLKPRWATDAVYRVLDSPRVIQHHGRFTTRDLTAIWSEGRYASMRDELVQLMMRFQLCYRLAESLFLAPQLLDTMPPEYPWEAAGNLVIHYEYEFMPKGILTRFIVATHPLIEREPWVWRNGVVLARRGARAEVTEDYSRRRITVRVSGQDRQELLAIVDYELERIHRDYARLKFSKLIPCRCAQCMDPASQPHFYPYEILLRFARDGRAIQCPVSYEMVSVGELLAAVFPQTAPSSRDPQSPDITAIRPAFMAPVPARKEVFVSYAWDGDSETIVDRLEQAFREREIAIIRDRNEVHYKDSITGFMQRLGGGTCIVIVISKKYIESKSCMFELTEIAERGAFRDRVFPIVLDDAQVDDALAQIEYVRLWESRIKALNAAMKEVNQEDLDGIRQELDLYAKIRRTITQLMKILRDLNASTPQRHLDSRFEDLVQAIQAQLNR